MNKFAEKSTQPKGVSCQEAEKLKEGENLGLFRKLVAL